MRSYISLVLAGFLVFAGLSRAAWAETYDVEMRSNEETGALSFKPSRLEIHSGDTVRWIQKDGYNDHNVVSYPNRIPKKTETFEGPLLSTVGDSWSHTFDAPGTYEYHCHPHEALGMRGVIIVGRESAPDEFRQSKPGEHVHDMSAHGTHMDDHEPMMMEHGEEQGG